MLELNNQYTAMKRRIDTEVLKLFFSGKLESDLDKLPYTIIPKDRTPNRCCIYKERAIVRYRIMALLGIDIERFDDEMKPLGEYAAEILKEDQEDAQKLGIDGTPCFVVNNLMVRGALPLDLFKYAVDTAKTMPLKK